MKSVQFGESFTGDFEESTWTFEMEEDFKLSAGVFAILREEDYFDILTQKNNCFSSLTRVLGLIDKKQDLSLIIDDNTMRMLNELEDKL